MNKVLVGATASLAGLGLGAYGGVWLARSIFNLKLQGALDTERRDAVINAAVNYYAEWRSARLLGSSLVTELAGQRFVHAVETFAPEVMRFWDGKEERRYQPATHRYDFDQPGQNKI